VRCGAHLLLHLHLPLLLLLHLHLPLHLLLLLHSMR
jgi:hypothetical protein